MLNAESHAFYLVVLEVAGVGDGFSDAHKLRTVQTAV